MGGDPPLKLGSAVVLELLTDTRLLLGGYPNKADESLLM